MGTQSIVCILLVALCAVPALADMIGDGGIGITVEADSLRGLVWCGDDGCPQWVSSEDEGFGRYDVSVCGDWVDMDIDLLISHAFTDYPQWLDNVSDKEVALLLRADLPPVVVPPPASYWNV